MYLALAFLSIISDLFAALGEIATSVGSLFADIFTAVAGFFYTPGTDGAAGTWTILGVLLLVLIIFSLIFWGVRLIISLFDRIRA